MKLEAPVNSNYVATVVTINAINVLDNCDNVVGVPVFGLQAIVSKDTVVGTRGIVFPPEVQLSATYTGNNNLYRHAHLNSDPSAQGYIEDNRRVKAMKFRGHKSNCLFMPLESLIFTGVDITKLEDGASFDQLNGVEICRKYFVKEPGAPKQQKNKDKKVSRVEEKFIPPHFDTDNYWRNVDKLDSNLDVVVTAKLHGTSIRIGNTVVARKLTWRDKLAKRFGIVVKEIEYDYVYGSRRVIKDPNNPDHNHFYDTDIWSLAGAELKGLLPEGFLVYGELLGWTPDGAAIQKNYTYGVPRGQFKLYVYRVAFVNSQGIMTDLGWDQLKEFCRDRNLNAVPELWRGKLADFDADKFIDIRFADHGYHSPPLEGKFVDEGVCVRIEGSLIPYILKAKSPVFLEHETKLLDANVDDIESAA